MCVGMMMEVREALLLKVETHASAELTASVILATVKLKASRQGRSMIMIENKRYLYLLF